MTDNQNNITEIAKKQRYAALINKIKSNKALNASEIKELEKYEKMAKKKETTSETTTRKLTVKQQLLVDSYKGNIKEAAKTAKLSYTYARELLTKPYILEILKNRQNTEVRPKTIAKRQERQEFWTEVMNDEKQDMKDRLKASELLGKSEADFTDNVTHSGKIDVPALKLILETPKK
jgi:hypothetical protein